MNSGRIFTEPRLPLFTEIEKNNCFSIYTGSDLNNIFRRKPSKNLKNGPQFMRGKLASGTKHARIRETIYRSKTQVCKILSLLLPLKTFIPNFVAFFVFSGTVSSCIFKISDYETLAKRD